MIQYSDSTVFNVDVQTIVNTINCMGVMGAGIALEFRLRFPKMYEDYLNRCSRKAVQIGKPYLYREYGDPWILNFPTKYHWKYPSKLEWIEQGLEYFTANYEQGNITSIAFPKLGSSRGKLEWEEVQSIMERHLQNVKIPIYICLDRERKATGIEGIMVNMINDLQDQTWISELLLKRSIADRIRMNLPVTRFYELMQIDGVGIQSYEKIFKFFYARGQEQVVSTAPKQTVTATQLSLMA